MRKDFCKRQEKGLKDINEELDLMQEELNRLEIIKDKIKNIM